MSGEVLDNAVRCCVTGKDNTRVALILNGVCVGDFPYQVAIAVGRALTQVGVKASNNDPQNANKLAEDVAIAWQAGMPFPLTGDSRIIMEAAKHLPGAGNIPEGSRVGTPVIMGGNHVR